ncbi:uncharacterized protein LOC129693911 [Leucoraja erinacea]|uniref:uncharacterized protein LOC129693911 n=1 Tax=Leucoraja erinaceus TaxID=7782 RepID=UPI0024558DDB|nr:uncharacterized protein LOC129693911 [Leucoraja erinacea]
MATSNQDNASQNEAKSLSVRSYCSAASSSASMAALKARAKAKAAEARAAFAQREIDIKVEAARIQVEAVRMQATLEALQQEKEMAAAIAEADTIEAGLIAEQGSRDRSPSPARPQNQHERTLDYVIEQASIKSSQHVTDYDFESGSIVFCPLPPIHQTKSNLASSFHSHHNPSNVQGNVEHKLEDRKPTATFLHSGSNNSPQATNDINPTTMDLAKYLARSQLVTTGLTAFNDKPENYWAWRSSFQNAIEGLGLSPGEELDLLVKWLGKESSEQATRIKAVNMRNPKAGLKMAWQRLEETYGSPESIEHALFTKLENFPRITIKEPYKLRELGDLMSEIEAAKADGYLPGLSYLDTSRGVAPIVEKLPYNIQEKWTEFGSNYKRRHRISFPPFKVFANFIRAEAKTRTDPSFNLCLSRPAIVQRDNIERHGKTLVSVHRTQASPTIPETQKSSDPSKQCPIHAKIHPLKKCRAFREKSLEDRKHFLKEHSICFRCCSSTSHFAKNCTAEVKCTECNSDRHLSALHPGPAP